MNRVLVLQHADCGHLLCVATDGTSPRMRAAAKRLLAEVHTAGHTHMRLRGMDSVEAKHAHDTGVCDRCRVDPDTVKALPPVRTARPVLEDS